MYEGELVQYVTTSPRYAGSTIKDILEKETQVGVARVLPGKVIIEGKRYEASDVDYWAIGTIRPDNT